MIQSSRDMLNLTVRLLEKEGDFVRTKLQDLKEIPAMDKKTPATGDKPKEATEIEKDENSADTEVSGNHTLQPIPLALTTLVDFNECEAGHSDCDSNAQCINTMGSFKCECLYGDMDPYNPGRVCVSKSDAECDCNGRGTCVGDECRCERMYWGRHCEINGLRKFLVSFCRYRYTNRHISFFL